MILYLWIFGTFIKNLIPLFRAQNYSLSLKASIFLYEILFLLKASYSFFFKKKIEGESFLGYKIKFTNYIEFVALFIEIFGIQEYRSFFRKNNPLILDLGSSFGMSIFYFKKLYPKAVIKTIEANEKTVEILKKNLKENKVTNVRVLNAIVSSKPGRQPFFIGRNENDWTVGDSGVLPYRRLMGESVKLLVESVRLSNLLKTRWDILKIDIEGMERDVLEEGKKELANVSEIFIEYHGSDKLPRNSLKRILEILGENNFKYLVLNTKNWIYRENNFLRIIHAVNRHK